MVNIYSEGENRRISSGKFTHTEREKSTFSLGWRKIIVFDAKI
jgi:hypothetical protein